MKARYAIPVIVFLPLFAVFGLILHQVNNGRNIKEVPSPLIGKPVPQFESSLLLDNDTQFSSKQLKGRVTLVNVWASWCVSCRAEHGLLMDVSRNIPIVGINYKDERSDALNWLSQGGNPYELNIYDNDGRIAIDWGVYGTPETFVVDQQGVIRYKHIGPISLDKFQQTILPLIMELRSRTGKT